MRVLWQRLRPQATARTVDWLLPVRTAHKLARSVRHERDGACDLLVRAERIHRRAATRPIREIVDDDEAARGETRVQHLQGLVRGPVRVSVETNHRERDIRLARDERGQRLVEVAGDEANALGADLEELGVGPNTCLAVIIEDLELVRSTVLLLPCLSRRLTILAIRCLVRDSREAVGARDPTSLRAEYVKRLRGEERHSAAPHARLDEMAWDMLGDDGG